MIHTALGTFGDSALSPGATGGTTPAPRTTLQRLKTTAESAVAEPDRRTSIATRTDQPFRSKNARTVNPPGNGTSALARPSQRPQGLVDVWDCTLPGLSRQEGLMSAEARLVELGLELPSPPEPGASYITFV